MKKTDNPSMEDVVRAALKASAIPGASYSLVTARDLIDADRKSVV